MQLHLFQWRHLLPSKITAVIAHENLTCNVLSEQCFYSLTTEKLVFIVIVKQTIKETQWS